MSLTDQSQEVSNIQETNVSNETTVSEPETTSETNGNGSTGETKKRKKKLTLEQMFLKVKEGVEIIQTDTLLQQHIAPFGYTPERLQEGKVLLDIAEQRYEHQKNMYGLQYAATEIFHTAWKEAAGVYMHIIETARLAFKNDPLLYKGLGLDKKRREDFGGWQAQAKLFFNNLLENTDAVAQLALYNQTQAQLEAGLQLVRDAVDKDILKRSATGEAQNATEERNTAFMDLKVWFDEFITIARIALKNNKQMLEKLNLTTPTSNQITKPIGI